MSRHIICDVCDDVKELDEEVAVLAVPSGWVSTQYADQPPINLDVCSPQCLLRVSQQMVGGLVPEPVPVAGEAQVGEQTREVHRFAPDEPPRPSVPDSTGVRIKTLGEHLE